MKINADKCWTVWAARVSGWEERWFSELTAWRSWFALRCMTQPSASAPYPASAARSLPLPGPLQRLKQSWERGQPWLRAKATCLLSVPQCDWCWCCPDATKLQPASVLVCHCTSSCSLDFAKRLPWNARILFVVLSSQWLSASGCCWIYEPGLCQLLSSVHP